ncbi:MAG: hypothetical protein FWF83_07270, partial [Clostridiales bacterium]|nr:hypothetical protein [Clostridiales bacterium]
MDRDLKHYNDFVQILLSSGFTMGGGNSEGIYAIVDFDWRQEPGDATGSLYGKSPIAWHTGDP